MVRFDVPTQTNMPTTTPYLLDVQSNMPDGLGSLMMVPLRSLKQFPGVHFSARLTPVFTIKGEDYLLETPKMGAVPERILKKALTSLANEQETITAALDFLFHGC